MASMFSYASAFNQDLSQWNVSSVTIADDMFQGASIFNSDLSTWDGE
jgi:surface protein